MHTVWLTNISTHNSNFLDFNLGIVHSSSSFNAKKPLKTDFSIFNHQVVGKGFQILYKTKFKIPLIISHNFTMCKESIK